jgi:hypothetical protein
MNSIRLDDSRLTTWEKRVLRQIKHRLDHWRDYQPPAPGWTPPTREALAPEYKDELDRVFGEK